MNVKKLISVATIMLTVGMIHAQGSNGLKIHYLGANHSLIQVKQPQKYLLLPVEETAPEATVNVLVNNKVEKVFSSAFGSEQGGLHCAVLTGTVSR